MNLSFFLGDLPTVARRSNDACCKQYRGVVLYDKRHKRMFDNFTSSSSHIAIIIGKAPSSSDDSSDDEEDDDIAVADKIIAIFSELQDIYEALKDTFRSRVNSSRLIAVSFSLHWLLFFLSFSGLR